ncbi:hypothetical protein [Streptomyces sp. NPDC002550]
MSDEGPCHSHADHQVVATVLRDPARHIGQVYELTGPRSVDMTDWPRNSLGR